MARGIYPLRFSRLGAIALRSVHNDRAPAYPRPSSAPPCLRVEVIRASESLAGNAEGLMTAASALEEPNVRCPTHV